MLFIIITLLFFHFFVIYFISLRRLYVFKLCILFATICQIVRLNNDMFANNADF